MDMAPPQAPPAIIQSTNQEAIDAIGRLVDAHERTIEQQSQLPALPDSPGIGSRDTFLAELDTFWATEVESASGNPPIQRAAFFKQQLASVMNDEATLRFLDGTLGEQAKILAARFARSSGQPLPAQLHALELTIGEVAYAGAVVIVDDTIPNLALLFMPDRGWEEFTSVATLCQATEDRLRKAMAQGVSLPGIMRDDLEWVVTDEFVGSRLIEGDTFDALVHRIMAVQRERVQTAWDSLEAVPGIRNPGRFLMDRVTPALRLHDYLDLNAIFVERDLRLALSLNEARLAAVPLSAREEWRDAMAGHATELRLAERARTAGGVKDVVSLDRFVRDALKTHLANSGIEDAPEDITVDVYPMPSIDTPSEIYEVLVNGVQPPATGLLYSVTLPELAIRNIGFLDRQTFRARGADGRNLAPTLNHAAIKAMVRSLDVATAYRSYLLRTLQTSPQGELARSLAGNLLRARMRVDSAEARLGTYLDDEPASFADDHAERGHAWVSAVLDAPTPATRQKVEGHDIVVRQLMYKNVPVKDIFLIGVRSIGSVANVVMYTPDAPDGRTFREFDDRRQAARRFLYAPQFEEYLLDRLPDDFATVAQNGNVRHFKLSDTDQRAHWALSGEGSVGVRTDEPFDERTIGGDFLDASYDTSVSLMARNLASSARSTDGADADGFSPRIDGEAIAHAIARFIGRPFSASWRTYDEIKAGDYASAFVNFTDAYTSSLDFLAAGALKPLLTGSIVARFDRHSRRAGTTGKRLRDADTQFESRFVVDHARATDAQSVSDGVLAIGDSRYIQQNGKMYGVRFDRDMGTWRLNRANALDAAFSGPAIARGPNGLWQKHAIGLRGGMPAGHDIYVFEAMNDALFELSPWQRRVATDTLLASTGNVPEAFEIALRMSIHGPARASVPPLSARQQALWNTAEAAGRQASVVRPHSVTAGTSASAGAAVTHPVQAGPVDLTWRPPAAMEQLLPQDWPEHLWHYMPREQLPRNYGPGIFLQQSRQPVGLGRGLNAMVLGPTASPQDIAAALQGGSLRRSLRRPVPAPPEGWVRIDMNGLRNRLNGDGNLAFNVFRVRDGLEVNYVIHPTQSLQNPQLSNAIFLKRGEFDLGFRSNGPSIR